MKLRVLFFDIETAPLAARIWSPWQHSVSHKQMLHDTFLLTWSAKWADEDEVLSGRLTSNEAIAQDDSRIVQSLADLVREADIVVAHNIDRFDLPRLNTRVMLLGQEPLGPTQTIDTLKLAKKNFGMAFNKLDWLAEQMGFGTKIDTDMELWHRCYVGEVAALKEMETYNKHDVVLLEKVFNKMKPYVARLTRLFDPDHEDQYFCVRCGGEGRTNFQFRGYYRTQASTFHKAKCKTCGAYSRLRTGIVEKKAKLYPL